MADDIEQNDAETGADEAAEERHASISLHEDEPLEDEAPGVATEVHELREELDALNDRHLRLAAEFDNYRKRSERERRALAVRHQADLVGALLDVLDDLQRVEASAEEGTKESLLEGFRLVEKKLISVLENAGLQPLDAEGKRFDPEYMEALMMVPTDDPEQDHQVADVFQRGYLFRDMLVRPARVRVLQYEESSDGGE